MYSLVLRHRAAPVAGMPIVCGFYSMRQHAAVIHIMTRFPGQPGIIASHYTAAERRSLSFSFLFL